jgi:hypothetical protein
MVAIFVAARLASFVIYRAMGYYKMPNLENS